MITTEDLLNLNFYKKERFTGSYQGMRYLIQKETPEDGSDVFRATVWPGPYNSETTADDLKTSATFPFTAEGKQQIADWLNAQWQARTDWPQLLC